ncbi:ABC transporter substrate-binding protein [Nonomuraea sp. NPDC005650]|uniref:ABC transporter substrate-binding protein n=1 Tax=Nonomuraea sp. NPDC005650 TaxID=3157045 RepID=UPI0033B94DB5
MHSWRRLLVGAVAGVLALAPSACGGGGGSAGGVTIGVGGQSLLVYLPTTLARQLGYYQAEGLDVRIEDLQGGSKALQALQGGSVDVVSGFYDHTIQLQAKRRELTAFVNMLRYPSLVLAVSPRTTRDIRSIGDLKGATVGVTAPGSSTDFFLKYLLVKHGLKADDAAVQGVGGEAAAVAAMENGKVDAAVMIDPAFSFLQKRAGADKVRVLSDTRTVRGVEQEFGVSTYPAAVLYSASDWVGKNKETAARLARAIKRTLEWVQRHSPQEIAAKMPAEYAAGDAEVYVHAIERAKAAFSPDGTIHLEGAEAVYGVLRRFSPDVAGAKIDLKRTFTNEFLGAG